MSGMDQFLANHYGTAEQITEPTAEDVEKVAQAEFFLKVAASNGIDINALSEPEINELWNVVMTKAASDDNDADDKKKKEDEEKAKKAAAEFEEQKVAAAEAQQKFAEADYMGRIMAHSYVNEMRGIAAEGGLDFAKAAAAITESGHKLDADRYNAISKAHHDLGKAEKDHEGRSPLSHSFFRPGLETQHRLVSRHADYAAKKHEDKRNAYNPFGGLLTKSRHEEADEKTKKSSALDEFAANLAIEKAASYGFDAEEAAQRITAVMVLGPGESDKVAFVDGLENAVDVRSSELLEIAGYPIDWSNTPFSKEARIKLPADMAADNKPGAHPQLGKGSPFHRAVSAAKAHGSDAAKRVAGAVRRNPGTAALAGGATALTVGGGVVAKKLHDRKKEKEQESGKHASVQFDLAAGELAIQKAAEAGWDPNEALDRVNSLFNLGYEGDPENSEKVASAANEEQALDFRACELLEMAGYQINW